MVGDAAGRLHRARVLSASQLTTKPREPGRSYTAGYTMERVGALAILALLLLCGSGRAKSSLEVQSSCRQLAKASDAADAKLTIARNFDNGSVGAPLRPCKVYLRA